MNQFKVAIITGASSGIGKAIAKHLAYVGHYQIILISRNIEKLKLAQHEILLDYPDNKIEILSLDVSKSNEAEKKMKNLLATLPHVDLLVNSAGYVKRGSSELALSEFEKMLQTNLVGAFQVIRLVAEKMKTQQRGRIINLSSISASQCRAEMGGYAASKAGLSALNESLYKELAPYGIYVTAISPNLVATEMTQDVTSIPQNALTPVEDIIKVIDMLLVLSPNSSIKEIVMQNTAKLITG